MQVDKTGCIISHVGGIAQPKRWHAGRVGRDCSSLWLRRLYLQQAGLLVELVADLLQERRLLGAAAVLGQHSGAYSCSRDSP